MRGFYRYSMAGSRSALFALFALFAILLCHLRAAIWTSLKRCAPSDPDHLIAIPAMWGAAAGASSRHAPGSYTVACDDRPAAPPGQQRAGASGGSGSGGCRQHRRQQPRLRTVVMAAGESMGGPLDGDDGDMAQAFVKAAA